MGRNLLSLVPKIDRSVIPENWGAIHCSLCEEPIAFIPPNSDVSEGLHLDLYCRECAKKEAKR